MSAVNVEVRVFKYRPGGKHPKCPPETAWVELNRISALCGGMPDPERIVEESRRKNAVFHGEFEWNDEVAGQKWRVHQARNIINVIQVVYPGQDEPVPAFPNITTTEEGERGYRDIEEVIENSTFRESLLADVKSRLSFLRRKYRALTELAEVWEAIDRAN